MNELSSLINNRAGVQSIALTKDTKAFENKEPLRKKIADNDNWNMLINGYQILKQFEITMKQLESSELFLSS